MDKQRTGPSQLKPIQTLSSSWHWSTCWNPSSFWPCFFSTGRWPLPSRQHCGLSVSWTLFDDWLFGWTDWAGWIPVADSRDSCVGRCDRHGVDPAYDCQCNPTCTKYKDCCSDYNDVCKGKCGVGSRRMVYTNDRCFAVKPGVSDAELAELSHKLFADDINGVRDIVLNLQSPTSSGDRTDRAPLP